MRVRTGHSINNSSVLGFVQNKGIYNDLEVCKENDYTWHRIADNQWIADNGEWLEILPITDYKKLYEKSLEEIEQLKNINNNLSSNILKLKDKLKQIHELSE